MSQPTSTPARASDARIIDVAMDIADVLLSMGMPAADVVATSAEFCRAFAERRVYVDCNSTVLTFSQDSDPEHDSLTVVRPVTGRPLNYMTMQSTLELAQDAIAGRTTLEEAALKLENLMRHQRRWPAWTQAVSAGLISAGCCLLFGTDVVTMLLTFVVGALGERTLFGVGRLGLPPLLGQAAAAAIITLSGLGVAAATAVAGVPLNPTPIIVGGIVMLVVGLMFVGAFQDALDEFYITSVGRLFKVTMLTLGIVIGMLFGLALAKGLRLGPGLDTEPLRLGPPLLTLAGAAVIAAAYAWYCHATGFGILASGIIGTLTWLVYLGVVAAGVHDVTATGLAAVVAGLGAALVARRWRIPALEVTTGGIVTMVPGLRLWNGLMQLASYPLWSPGFLGGATTLVGALSIGLAIAIGASLGLVVGRPIRQRLVLARNARGWRRLVGRR